MTKTVAKVTFPLDSNRPYHIDSLNKLYNYLCDIDGLQKGDTVVVDTVNGLKIAFFEKYDSLGFGETGVKEPSKWIIQKVDLDAYNKRIEAAAKVEKLKTMMEAQRKKAQELEIYEILAKTNPEMAALLDEYKQLQEVL